ncbi:MAG: hypothetical protein KC442_15410 [Thermomicrobiales bacterium]|nr:hypothetical protein [Thermomicrobiales bacterium]
MDADRFDAFARLAAPLSRRRGVRLLGLLGALGVSQVAIMDEAAAKKKKKVRLCLRGQTITVPKKKREQFLLNGARLGACPPPTCTDSLKNGDETDVDCGGSCPRCANGLVCDSRDDCASALCVDSRCVSCVPNNCGTDANGGCFCDLPAGGGPRVCNTRNESATETNCGLCPAGTNCVAEGGSFKCFKPCGAP